jgi:fucose permease
MSEQPVPADHPAISRWSVDLMALTLMLFFMLMAACLSVMPVVHGELGTRFNLSDSQVGLLTSVFMFAFGAIGIPAGVGAARWGGRMFAL